MSAAILSLTSCMKDEIPVAKTASGEAEVVTVSSGAYQNQVYYNLAENKIYTQINREIWDLGFQNTADGDKIIINTSKVMGVFKTAETDLAAITSDANIVYTHDDPHGDIYFTAIGDWTDGKVYLVNRGVQLNGNNIGKIKMKVLASDATSFTIEWAPLSATTTTTSTIQKAGNGNFTYFSFEGTGSVVTVEADKTAWDLVFTSYMHIYEDGMPYNVFAPILNRHNTTAARVSSKDFKDIKYMDYLEADMTPNIDIIGFDWKTYNFGTGIYDTDPSKSFIVKTQHNRIFKIHFLDFYDAGGVKGAPTMELQELFPE